MTPETTEALAEMLRIGHTYAVACAHAGISYQTFLNWKAKAAEQKTGEYVDFFDTIFVAEMEGRQVLEAKALTEAPALEILGRRYPEDWGRQPVISAGEGLRKITVEWATGDET